MKRNLLISVLLGIVYWMLGQFAYYFWGTLHNFLVVAILPLLIGISIYFCLKDLSNKEALLFCVVAILTREVILNFKISILLYFYNNGQTFILESIKAFLFIGPIQMIFSLTGYMLIKGLRDKLQNSN